MAMPAVLEEPEEPEEPEDGEVPVEVALPPAAVNVVLTTGHTPLLTHDL
jgi:hypothetical protein